MIALMKRILSVSGPYQGRIKLAFVFAFLKAMLSKAPIGLSFLALSAFLQGTMTARLCLWLAVGTVGCVLLDYLLAFTVLGFACLIAKPFRSRTVGVGVSAFVVCLLRFLCSFLSGYIVWKDYDYAFSWMTEIGFPGISNMSVDGLCWLYSAVYNATYMLPEAILTTVLVVILIRVAPQIFDPQNARA